MQIQLPLAQLKHSALSALLLIFLCDLSSARQVDAVCGSSELGDVDYEACFGWCSVLEAKDHCKWCKCRGCPWCAADTAIKGDEQTSSTTLAVDCTAEPGAPHIRDCQEFCSASAKSEHCPLCKCKACSFCTCRSDHEEDSTEEMCEPWCTIDYYEDHCSRCKCKGCHFCLGKPCESTVNEDFLYESCEGFCSMEFASSHCEMCKCKGCGFCVERAEALANAKTQTCNSGVKDDTHEAVCEAFCDPKEKQSHCGMCKCRACDFCTCSSPHEGDSSLEECQKWCNGDHLEAHCDWCACKGCSFCRLGGKPCQSFFLLGDTDHEECQGFCDASSKDTHCSMCKCKRCDFCKEESKPKLVSAASAVAAPSSSPSCFSGVAHDFLYESCEAFCDKSMESEHCKLCKCKGCKMCAATCDSGVPDDADAFGCSSMCDAAEPDAMCSLCRCRGCSFCRTDGDTRGSSSPAAVGQCAADGAAEAPSCMGHCKEASKASHCETCKCKGCKFCENFEACSSGKAHDTKWIACELEGCSGKDSCDLCKCRACEHCKTSGPAEACNSGIEGDVSHATCLASICSAEHADAHCQTCRCLGCSFCRKQDKPKVIGPKVCTPATSKDANEERCEGFCNPTYSAEHCKLCKCKSCPFCVEEARRANCKSRHIADSLLEECDASCRISDWAADALCSLCMCRGCDVCASSEARFNEPFDRIISQAGDACIVGVELLALSVIPAESNGVFVHLCRVRVGDWQAGSHVVLDFTGGPKLFLEDGSIENAALEKQTDAARVFTFMLGDKAGPLNTFALTFRSARSSLTSGDGAVRLTCLGMHSAPPPALRPPPPPRPPYVSPPPLPRPALHSCILGGKLRIIQKWAGGSSFRAQAIMAVWRPGAHVTFDFGAGHGGGAPFKSLHITTVSNAAAEGSPWPGALRFKLGPTPDAQHGFAMIGHGAEIHEEPRVWCKLGGPETQAASAAEKGPQVDETCAMLGPTYSIVQTWEGGFKAAVALRKWQPGATISIQFGFTPQLLSAWSATGGPVAGEPTLSFVLGPSSDEEVHGFSFTARGMGAETPRLRCTLDVEAASLTELPKAACGMGLAFALQQPEGADAAADAKQHMRLRIHQWEPGALVSFKFNQKVGVDTAIGASEQDSDISATHTFELAAHPDDSHGFSFDVHPKGGASAQLLSVVCKPRPSGLPQQTADVHVGSPEAPEGLQLQSASCNGLVIRWRPPVDNGFRVYNYILMYRRQDALEDNFETVETAVPFYSLSGLAGGATYFVKVRAQNERGLGKFSSRLAAATESAGAPRSAASSPVPVRSRACDSITLSLPPLRSGCRGDAFLAVQGRTLEGGVSKEGGPQSSWTDLISRTAETVVRVSSLDAYTAYEFRLVAHNQDGEAPPSVSTGAMLTDAEEPLSLSRLLVLPTSSASFALTWSELADACRPELTYAVSVGHSERNGAEKTAETGPASWTEVLSGVRHGTAELYPLRCPLPGCWFRVHPSTVRGLDSPWATAGPFASLVLSPKQSGTVRAEIRLREAQHERDLIRMRAEVEAELASALHVDLQAVTVRDVYGGGRYIVLDLQPALQPEGFDVTSAEVLAQQLQLMVRELGDAGGGNLASGSVTSEIDVDAGVQILLDDGRLTQLHIGEQARETYGKLPRLSRWHKPLAPATRITIMLCLIGGAIGCLYNCFRQRATALAAASAALPLGQTKRVKQKQGYGRLQSTPPLEDDEEGMLEMATEEPLVRSKRAVRQSTGRTSLD